MKLVGGFAGAAALAAAVWLFFGAGSPPPPQPASVVKPQPAAPRERDAIAQPEPPVRQVEAATPKAVFEARFKASRERLKPPPDPAIAQARTFQEAFAAMKRAEAGPPVHDAAANPFAAR